MTQLASLVACLAGFAALAAATSRVQIDLWRREFEAGRTRCLRLVGWTSLLASLAVLVGAQGWGLGLVSYSGHTSLAAGLVYLALVAGVRWRTQASKASGVNGRASR